jgi:zinc and cadmium transporter
MLDLNLQILLASLSVSLISLIGLFTFGTKVSKYAKFFVSIATGAILGDIFYHILPEVLETPNLNAKVVFSFVLAGIIVMFLIESVFRHIHCHEILEENHNHDQHKHIENPLGKMNLIGNSLHNFLDGALIAASFLVSPVAGWATTFAIITHEIPVEMGNYMILIHSGYTKSKALFYNFVTAGFGLLGSVAIIILGQKFQSTLPCISAFAAGFLLYIALSDLVPEIHINHNKKPNYFHLVLIILAILFMYYISTLE